MAVSQTATKETSGKTLHLVLKTACRLRPHRYVLRESHRQCGADNVLYYNVSYYNVLYYNVSYYNVVLCFSLQVWWLHMQS